MTRESKVGLFIGLGFIILFAVVIAEKGQSGRRTSPADFGVAQADPNRAARPVAGADRSAPVPDEGRLPLDRVLPNPTNTVAMKPLPSAGSVTAHRNPAPRTEMGLPELPRSAMADKSGPADASGKTAVAANKPSLPDRTGEALAMNDRTQPLTPGGREMRAPVDDSLNAAENAARETARTALPAPLDSGRPNAEGTKPVRSVPVGKPVEPSNLDKLREAMDSLAKKAGAAPVEKTTPPAARPELARNDPPKPAVELAKHTVRAGDSLFSIAKKRFGAATPQVVDALFEANRHTLKSRNAIRAGQELVIPVVAGFEDRLAMGDSPASATLTAKSGGTSGLPRIPEALDARPKADDSSKRSIAGGGKANGTAEKSKSDLKLIESGTHRTYVVRANDTLGKIAARELGDAGRAKELAGLNHDRVARADRLTVGTALRLPERETAVAKSNDKGANDKSVKEKAAETGRGKSNKATLAKPEVRLARADVGADGKTGKAHKAPPPAVKKPRAGKSGGEGSVTVATARKKDSRDTAAHDAKVIRGKGERGKADRDNRGESGKTRPRRAAEKRPASGRDGDVLASPAGERL